MDSQPPAADILPPDIEAYPRTKQMAMLFFVSLACFFVLYFFFNIKTFYLVFLGCCLVITGIYLIKDFLDKSPRVVINQEGVYDKRLGVGTILWKDIKRVYGVSLNNVDHVCLELYNEDKYLDRRSAITNLGGKIHKTTTEISPFNIVTANLDYDYDEIFEAIATGCEIYAPKRQKTDSL